MVFFFFLKKTDRSKDSDKQGKYFDSRNTSLKLQYLHPQGNYVSIGHSVLCPWENVFNRN